MFVDRLDDLAVALRKPGAGASVIVAKTAIFGEQKLKHYDLKRRFTLGVVFRYWGNRFNDSLPAPPPRDSRTAPHLG